MSGNGMNRIALLGRVLAPWLDVAYVRDVLRRRWWGLSLIAALAFLLGCTDDLKGVRELAAASCLWAAVGAALIMDPFAAMPLIILTGLGGAVFSVLKSIAAAYTTGTDTASFVDKSNCPHYMGDKGYIPESLVNL